MLCVIDSVSSEGSSESHLVEQEDIVALTQEVRAFKEALGKLRRIFHYDKGKNQLRMNHFTHTRAPNEQSMPVIDANDKKQNHDK